MKNKLTRTVLALLALSTLDFQLSTAHAQGTAFTYQGQLNDNGNPANGSYDLQFILFNVNQFGFPGAPILTNDAVPVSNGLFTTILDFGGGIFTGTNFWIEIGVRTNGGDAFVPLVPRQPITPTPYAITAKGLSGVVENNLIQGGVSLGTISGGGGNTIQSGANFSTVGGGGNNVIQTGADHSTIGGGSGNNIAPGAWESFVGGGQNNYIYSHWSAIGGGLFNTIQTNADYSFIGGGYLNTVKMNASYSAIGGGNGNQIQNNSIDSTISGGFENTLSGLYSFIGGGSGNTIQAGSVEGIIGGGAGNTIQTNAGWSTIGGGIENTIQPYATYSTIGGGRNNTIQTNGQQSLIGGGYQNIVQANAQNDFIGGGYFNVIQANAYASTIGGGGLNTNGGSYSTILGGYENTASGNYSFAAGQQAQALHQGAFVWADSQNAAFSSTASDQFLVRAQGGVGINMNNPNGASLYVQGNRNGGWGSSVGYFENASTVNNAGLGSSPALRVVVDGGSSPDGALSVSVNGNGTGPLAEFGNANAFVVTIQHDGTVISKGSMLTSDRNAKENFTVLDAKSVLAKVISLPVTEWNYKDDAEDKKHIGPVAQDFYAAFDLNGTDDKHISVVDEGGVALAAIQGLNKKVEASGQNAEVSIRKLEAENAELRQSMAELKAMVKQLVAQK
jgi:trimeric autotransporter adhesin